MEKWKEEGGERGRKREGREEDRVRRGDKTWSWESEKTSRFLDL